jgi:hypothetical protein
VIRACRSKSQFIGDFDLQVSCAPAISIAISIYFDLFRSISIISIISIPFDSDIGIAKTFRCLAGHFDDRSITSQQKWRMMAAVATSLLPLSLPLCRNMTYHGVQVWL